MDTLRMTNYIIAVVFFVCYTYQFLYIPVPWLLAKRKAAKAAALEATPHNYAVLICARNESAVIADLIGSLRSQTYDQSLLHIFVLADNCTDDTSDIARSAGATVYERFNNVQVGKGYALQTLLGHLEQDYPAGFDGYFVFDADNILDPDYIAAMNRTFSQGHDIVTSYRNSKNYGDNWISAGYALWFLRESRYLNHARSLLGTSCAVSGTGFLFSRAVLEETGPWPFHLLTEDIQFSVHEILQGRKVAFAPDAVLYDEQPTTFRQSWRQRMRWSQGYLQVFRDYGARLRPLHRQYPRQSHAGCRRCSGRRQSVGGLRVRGADAAEYIPDSAGVGRYHHHYRVEEYPHLPRQEDRVYVHLPLVYVHLHSHFFGGFLLQAPVEAHRAPGLRSASAEP